MAVVGAVAGAVAMTEEAAPALGACLVRQAAGLELEGVPAPVLAQVKLSFLDFLSCVHGALDAPWNAALLAYAGQGCGSGPAGVVGAAERLPPAEAAFVNSALAAGASRSDMHPPSVSHPALVIFPTLLALAPYGRPSGRDFLLAALAGYEAMGRIGRALVTRENSRRFRPTGLCGPVAAALAGARLLGLDERASLSAMGIAGNAAGGLMEWAWSGAPDLRHQPADAARAAVAAVLFARAGGEGSHSILEGPSGLLATFEGPAERRGLLAAPWGTPFEIEAIEYKAVPICVHAQASAFAALRLLDEGAVEPDAVAGLEIATYRTAVDYPGCAQTAPVGTAQEARMSIPFAVASVLVLGGLTDRNFAAVGDARIERLMALTDLHADPAMDAAFPARQQATLRLTLRDGTCRTACLEGLPPFGPPQVRARFRACAEAVAGAAAATAIETAVERLEEQADLGGLLSTLFAADL